MLLLLAVLLALLEAVDELLPAVDDDDAVELLSPLVEPSGPVVVACPQATETATHAGR